MTHRSRILTLSRPQAVARKEALDVGLQVFRKSDESAFSIVPSRTSIRTRDTESLLSFESRRSLVYRELTIDSDLFTARVYKRNYRNALINDLFTKAKVLPDRTQNNPTQLSMLSGRQTEHNLPALVPTASNPGSDLSNESVHFPSYSANIANWRAAHYFDERARNTHIASTWLVGEGLSLKVRGPRLPAEWFDATCTPATEPLNSNFFNLASEVRNSESNFIDWILHEGQDLPKPWLHHCLMTACLYGRNEIVSLLLQNLQGVKPIRLQSDPLQLDYIDDNPIDLAFHQGYMDVVKTLLEYLRSTTKTLSLSSGQLLIRRAIMRNDMRLLASLVKLGIPLHHRYYYGDYYGDDEGMQLLQLACHFGFTGCVEILRGAGAKVNTVGHYFERPPTQFLMPDSAPESTSLHSSREATSDPETRLWAVGESLKVLVKGPRISDAAAKSLPDEAVNTSFIDLKQAMKHRIFFRRLFTACDVFPKDWLGHCLWTACHEGWTYLADMVLTVLAGSDLAFLYRDIAPLYPFTDPLEPASVANYFDNVELLLALPPYTELRLWTSELLRSVIRRDDSERLAVLITHCVNIDEPLRFGMKAIHVACQHRSRKCIKLLIEQGAHLGATDDSGKCANDYLKGSDIAIPELLGSARIERNVRITHLPHEYSLTPRGLFYQATTIS